MANLRDVASDLGLSVSTVSRALNGRPHIDEGTRKRVREAAKRLNYQPNALARALRQSETKTVGLVIPNMLNQFYAAGADVLQSTLEEHGYRLIVCVNNDDPATDRACLTALLQYQVDGIVHVPCTAQGARWIRDANHSVPLIELNRCSDEGMFDSVVPDDRAGAYQLARHVLEIGHRRIAIIAGPPSLSTTRARIGGTRDALRDHGLEPEAATIRYGTYTKSWGLEGALELLGLDPRPTVIFATGNQIVLGALQAITQEDLRVPYDLSLIGFDDPDWFSVWRPAITTYRLPLRDMGLVAAQLLLARMGTVGDSEGPTRTRLAGGLVIRESAGPPSALLKLA